MGKEAKLGVAVIALLLLTLGAVATWRLIRADEQANPDSAAVEEAADADREGASPTVDDAGQPEDPQPEAERRQSAAALLRRAAGANTDSRKPTVLSPQAGAAEQETADFDAAKWEDLAEARTADAAGVPPDVPAQRSYMPSTESPTVAEPHEQYGQAVADDSSGAEQGESRYGRYHRSTDPFPQRPRDSGGESREETETIQPTPPVPDETTENNFSYRERRRSLDQGQPNDRPSNRWSTGHSADAPPDKAAAQSSPVQSSSATARIHVASSGRGERSPDGTYEVQPNDNFWKISEKLYGTGGYFKALVAHNRDRVERPDRLQVGQVLDAPDVAELEADHPDLCPKPEHRYVARDRRDSLVSHQQGGTEYTVQEGDTLYRIARYELGDATRWAEIYRLNREVIGEDYDHLRPGTALVLPASADDSGFGTPASPHPPDAVTRRPGATWRR